MGMGMGMGMSIRIGIGIGMGMGTGIGMGIGMGMGMGMGMGIGMGIGMGMGMGMGAYLPPIAASPALVRHRSCSRRIDRRNAVSGIAAVGSRVTAVRPAEVTVWKRAEL